MFAAVRDNPITTSKVIAGKKHKTINYYYKFYYYLIIINLILYHYFFVTLDAADVDVSKQIIIRRMKTINLHSRRAVRKFFNSEIHAEDRLKFANLFSPHPAPWWRPVIFCDEKTCGLVFGFKSFIK